MNSTASTASSPDNQTTTDQATELLEALIAGYLTPKQALAIFSADLNMTQFRKIMQALPTPQSATGLLHHPTPATPNKPAPTPSDKPPTYPNTPTNCPTLPGFNPRPRDEGLNIT